MGATNKYVELDQSALLKNIEIDHSSSVSCKILKDGTMQADRDDWASDGVDIETTAIGTPDKFAGHSLLIIPKVPSLNGTDTIFNSENLGEHSDRGASAELGKIGLQKCFDRMPSV